MRNLGLKLVGVGLMLPLGLGIGALLPHPVDSGSQTVQTQTVGEIGGTQGVPTANVESTDASNSTPAREENTGGGTTGSPATTSPTPTPKQKTQEAKMTAETPEPSSVESSTEEPPVEESPTPTPTLSPSHDDSEGQGSSPKWCWDLSGIYAVHFSNPCKREFEIEAE